MKNTSANKVLRFIVIFCFITIAYSFGYIGRGMTDKPEVQVVEEYFFEKSAVVYAVDDYDHIITFETKDGNLWDIEADTNDFVVGEEWTVVFNEQGEIIDLF